VLLNQFLGNPQIGRCQAIVLGNLDLWFHPELGLAMAAMNMYMHSRLLSGEEKEPEPSLTKDSRTHKILPYRYQYA
jgi:hypothetical protein